MRSLGGAGWLVSRAKGIQEDKAMAVNHNEMLGKVANHVAVELRQQLRGLESVVPGADMSTTGDYELLVRINVLTTIPGTLRALADLVETHLENAGVNMKEVIRK
jgi:hypothetical protein